jgi:methyltransferase (TIGR00027 family)
LITAAFRAHDSARNGVCHDPWAGRLAGEEAVGLAADAARRVPEASVGVALRTRYFDHLVERYAARGSPIRQVVLLGAGLDTRAARLKREGVRFFEVDHPPTQADKRARLEALGDYPVEAASYVACDFESADFLDALLRAGFDANVPALVLCEGVTAFLTEAVVRDTLIRLSNGLDPRSVVVFDYLADEALVSGEDRETAANVRAVADEAGEPLRFATRDPSALLRAAGLSRMRVRSMEEVCLTLTGIHDPRRRMLSLWGIAVASRAADVD